MAHNVIPLSSVQLIDRWPGPVNPNVGVPTNGWDNTVSNFQTSSGNIVPVHGIGEKRMAYTDNTHAPGWYTMMYLSYHSFESGEIAAAFSGSTQMCTHAEVTDCEWYDNSHTPYFVVTNEITIGTSDYSKGARIAFPCASLSSDGTDGALGYGDSWAWFWVGGVCPCKDATILDATLGLGLGVDYECASTYEGGPLSLDLSTSVMTFKEHIYGAQTPNIYGVQQNPVVGYGDISGS